MPNPSGPDRPRLAALVLFATILIAFVVQSALTQYLQVSLGFKQPFFLFYAAHSAFSVIFPLHLLYLRISTGTPIRSFTSGLAKTFRLQFGGENGAYVGPLVRLIVYLTCGVTVPALLWYIAVSYSSISDITAIWNTNAIWALILTSYLYNNSKIEPRKLTAVLLAVFGVFFVVYGDGTASQAIQVKPKKPPPPAPSFTSSLIGDAMTLVASLGYAAYQVFYTRYASLPNGGEAVDVDYRPLVEDPEDPELETPTDVYPSPFGLHPNFLTSSIGVTTLLCLWPALPLLDHFGAETFRLPASLEAWLCLAGIAGAGVAFNAGFMVLLGIWGPVLVSVGNLLTIVLMLAVDLLLLGRTEVTMWSLLGCGMIAGGFAVLAWQERSQTQV